MTSEDPYTALGAFLTAYEAERLAALLEAGETTMRAQHGQLYEQVQPPPRSHRPD